MKLSQSAIIRAVVFAIIFAILGAATSLIANFFVLAPAFRRIRYIDSASIAVYSFYYCLIYVTIAGMITGGISGWLSSRKGLRICVVALMLLVVGIFGIQAWLFP